MEERERGRERFFEEERHGLPTSKEENKQKTEEEVEERETLSERKPKRNQKHNCTAFNRSLSFFFPFSTPLPPISTMSQWLAGQAGRYDASQSSQAPQVPAEESRTPPSVRRSRVAAAAAAAAAASASSASSSVAFRSGNERLYEAYNDLHALAQDFQKPFDAPAILVVGHQTDGKSGE